MDPWLDDKLRAALLPELEAVRALGRGATAEVLLAREPALQRLVAVKVLLAELAADSVARERFEREARSAARISHPHVTAIHRVGRTPDGRPFIVMEYIEGRTLADMLAPGEPLDEATACSILAAIARALAAAHQRGVIHRDVRPANVLVEHRTGRAVLGDFGIAALLETGSAAAARLTAAGMLLGDVQHNSPEQIRGESVIEQSDVYSFGVLAYEVLTGAGPFQARSGAEMLAAHLQQKPPDLRALRPQLPPRLAALLTRCLAKDPNQRPLAAELAVELADGGRAEDAGTGAEAAGSLSHLMAELRRRHVYKVLAAYIAFAVTTLGVAEVVFDAFELSRASYRWLVSAVLAALPVTLVLAWVYDISAGRIERTAAAAAGMRVRVLMWAGFAASLLFAVLLGWLLLR
jgi:tRNA A-37 threonylcarbamoyl transferase component Bud32